MSTDSIINVNGDSIQALDVTLLLVVITLLPTLMVMMTSFTKFVVSLSFLRTAMGTQQTPPNSVLVGMALVLTLFAMTPTLGLIKDAAYDPYVAGQITQEEFSMRSSFRSSSLCCAIRSLGAYSYTATWRENRYPRLRRSWIRR